MTAGVWRGNVGTASISDGADVRAFCSYCRVSTHSTNILCRGEGLLLGASKMTVLKKGLTICMVEACQTWALFWAWVVCDMEPQSRTLYFCRQ